MSQPYDGQSTNKNVPGVSGESTADGGVGVSGSCVGSGGLGVWGSCDTGHGVHGQSKSGRGVYGSSESQAGVYGKSNSQAGVWGESTSLDGVYGVSHSQHRGVVGVNDNAQGGQGVWGESTAGEGVRGISHSQHGGVVGVNDNAQGGAGVWGQSSHGDAGHFEGNVTVTGDIKLAGADFAEEFDIQQATDVEPGTVMVLDQEGALQPSQQAYDKHVAGVISGAGNYKPGLVLDKQQSSKNRMPVALVGKVYCKVDAQYAPIEVGDLLTTSPTSGHAMRADNPLKAFGSVIGKALRPFKEGQGLIPILIVLQ